MAPFRCCPATRVTLAVLVACMIPAMAGLADPPAETPATEQPAVKPKREGIYNPEADGKKLIAAALERARLEGKHVLIEWGGNWCGWCHKLHDVFSKDPLVQPIVYQEYELVLIDSTSNRELMRHYGGKDRKFSYPHLTILDERGEVLTNQNTEPLEEGRAHNPERVAEFLKKWQPERVDAGDLLASALRKATEENKRVLLHVGTPYCGWCKVLTKFLHAHEDLFARDYVDLKVDTMRMQNADEVTKPFLPEGSNGVPWMVILDGLGNVIANGVASGGNIGYPYDPAEIEHFIAMLTSTRQRLTDGDLQRIRGDLDQYRIDREQQNASREAEREKG